MDIFIKQHPLRDAILAEVHARPYRALTTPRAVLQQAFLCKPSSNAQDDMAAFWQWCINQDLTPPETGSRHHTVVIDGIQLIWERHTEFITLTWDCLYTKTAQRKLWQISAKHVKAMMANKHSLISAARVNLLKCADTSKTPDLREFDPESICMSLVKKERALIITDFMQDEFGATKYTIHNRGLDDRNCGILVRRLLETETYRMMSLYGFERIKKILPEIAAVETQLVHLMKQVNTKSSIASTRKSLDEITDIAADLAKLSAASQYRFSASRAYYSLVKARLKRINEQGIPSYSKIEEFLNKRLAPAMRTVENVEQRIAVAGDKLDRSTGLLRTKVEMQMQVQNKAVLDSMNERALMQYRLQSTVEGLSIAAVSYYVVGLLNYVAKGIGIDGYINPKLLTAIFVPIAILTVWYIVRRIRAKHK
ncbi:MAG: DUF3422 domain-containing protein [Robiginitomaculum sp.]|nr:DUF3422 domain-containing protein [Robiginitomaculum sp.]